MRYSERLRDVFLSGFASSLGTGAAIITAAVLGACALLTLAHFGEPESTWLVCKVFGVCAP